MVSEDEQCFRDLHRVAGLDEHYATDLDLVFADKKPKRITAFIEFKNPDESITFTQSVVFDKLTDIADVFIIRARDELASQERNKHRFDVLKFIETVDSQPHPPIIETELIHENISWGGKIEHPSKLDFIKNGGDGLIGWEHVLRKTYPTDESGNETVGVNELDPPDDINDITAWLDLMNSNLNTDSEA